MASEFRCVNPPVRGQSGVFTLTQRFARFGPCPARCASNIPVRSITSWIANQGDILVSGNSFLGGGANVGSFNPGAGTITITNNLFDNSIMQPASGNLGTGASLRLIYYAEVGSVNNNVIVSGNTFQNHRWAASVENFKNVTFDNNSFTSKVGSTDYIHISFNTKIIASTSASGALNMFPVGATLTGNTFNGSGAPGGTALAFYNHRSTDAVFGTYTIGTIGNENDFMAGIAKFILLDSSTGLSSAWAGFGGYGSTPVTTMAPWSSNLDAQNNRFDVGAGLTLPPAMTLGDLFSTEDRIDHATDTAGLGFVRVKATNVYVTQTSGSIQRGINPATPGDTVNVNDGTYDAKVSINKTIALLSANGSAVTTIQDSSSVGLGTIQVVGPTTGVQIGASGRGFTVNGIDSLNPGIEFAAVYFQGDHSNASVIGNRIVAAGDAGLLTEFGLVTDTMTVSENEFSGQTFIGPNPADVGFGNQFSVWNVPRQFVVISSGSGGVSKTNITFTCNTVTGTSGGTNISNQAQGNTLVTIDSVGSSIQNNTFTGVSTRFAESLRVRGPGAIVSGNTFAGNSPIGVQIYSPASATAHVTNNSFATSYPAALVNGGTLLNAQNNWWGNVSGPAHASNPGGLGALVLGSVDISPWLGSSSDISGTCGFQPNLASIYYAPHHLVFSTQPGDAGINSPFPPQPVVQVIGENNTLATTFNGSVTVAINSGTPGAVLSGGLLTVPVSSGVAIFSGLQIDLAGPYTLSAASASPIIGTNSAPVNVANALPSISTLSPPWAVAGDPGFTLTVNGSDFVYDSVVRWGGSDRVTTYVSPTQLTVSISAADIASVGFVNVTVFNDAPGGGESAPASFEVKPVPTVVYVDDDYTSGSSGGHIWGYDAFDNVQSGINRVSSGGTVDVAAGSYSENVLANKPVTLLGANQGIAGCGVRGAESTISGGAGIAVDIQSDGVTVDGFALTGATGLRDVGYELVVVRHNAITAAAVGVDLEGIAPTAVASVIVSNNCVTLTSQLAGPNPTVGVLVAGVSGTVSPVIENNSVSAGFYGYLLYDANASVKTVIKGGTVTGVRQGLAVVNYAPPTFPTLKPSSFTADSISMSGFAGASTHAGVYVFTGGADPLAVVTATIKNLNVTGTGKPVQDSAGIVLADFSTAAGVRQSISVEDCTITNNLNRGISVRGSNCVASVTRSVVENNGSDPFGLGGNDGFGIVARESSSLFVMESSFANPASVAGGYSVTALAAHTGAQVVAISNSVANGVWATAKLAHNDGGLSQLNASGNWLGSTSETIIAGLVLGSVDFTPYLDSGADISGAFGFQGDFATLHVTTLGSQIGAVPRIQEGVDMVSGSTVLVEAGAYSENVVINKKVVVDGTGSGVGAGDRLTIKDIRVTGGSDGVQVNAATGTRQWYRFDDVAAVNNSSAGIALTGVATLGEVEVAGSVLSNNGVYGLQVADTLAVFAALAVSGGSMDNNGNRGLAVDGTDANPTSPTGISVTGTTFNGNGTSSFAGDGDVSFFLFNGDAALTNVTVTADAQFPIQLRGKGTASPGTWAALGTVRLENVTVSGATTRPGLYIVRYSDVANVSFENVNLSGLVPPVIPSGFASVMQVQHTGVTPLNLHGLTLQATYVGGPPVGYGALAMLASGGAIADCTTVIVGATTVQELEGSVYDQQDNAAVGDVVFPTLLLTPVAPSVIAECTGGGSATVTFASPTVTADCPPTGAVVCTPASGSIFALGTNIVSCTVTDNRGISNSTTFAVIVLDTTSPDIVSCAPNTNVVADAFCNGITPNLTGLVVATDGCGSGSLVVTQSPTAGSSMPLGPNAVTLTVTDPSGNFNNCVATVTVVDVTAPTVSFWPTNRTLNVGAVCDVLVPDLTVEVVATDSCSSPIIVTQSPLAGTSVGLGLTTITVTVADQVGNATSNTIALTIIDTIAPGITCPADVTVNRLAATDPYATGFATSTDNCTNVTVTYDDNRSSLTNCNASGFIFRTWTATDAATNTTTCVQTITIVDTNTPLFTSSQTNIPTTNDVGLCSAVVNFPMLTAVDVGYDQGFENSAWVSGGYPSIPSVDWNAYSSPIARVTSGTDGIVSKAGGAHAVINSTTVPAFTGAFNRLGGYSSVFGSGFKSSVDVYLDLSDSAVSANTYGWDVSTAANNQSGGHRRDFVFHSASDTNGNILIAASNNSGFTRRNDLASINHYAVTTSGWYTLEWVFRDNAGVLAVDCNLRDASGTLLWTETRSDPSDLIATVVGGNRYMWFTFLEVNKLAMDNAYLERNATVVCTPASGSTFNVGTNVVNCVASDACGNTTTNSFTVTVNDVEAPTITVPTNITTTNDVGACGAVVSYSAPATDDNCAVAGTALTTGLASGSLFPVGTTVNTFVVTDIHGNTATNSFTVTVSDVEAPTIAVSPNITTTNDVGLCSAVVSFGAPVTGDNCAVSNTVQIVGLASGSPFPVGTTVNTFVVTDIHGNLATNSFTVTVNDVQPPIAVAGTIATCYETSILAEAAAIAATSASDNCGVASTNILSTVGTCSAVITVRVTDIHGTFTDVSYNTRIDPTAPVIGLITATEVQMSLPVNVKNNDCLTNPVIQGTVQIVVVASDNCSLVGGSPSVTLVNGTNIETATFVSQSGDTNTYTWVVTSATANGTWTATVAASDICHNTTTNFTLCVNKTQVTGLVQLEGFTGTSTNINHTRLVTFVATGGVTNKTWNLTLTNVSGDTFNYTLTDVPADTTGISAKTDWNLREKLAVVLDINGQATADFIGNPLDGWLDAVDHYLRGCDISAINPALRDNSVQFFDYSVLGSNFFTFNSVADVTGDGQVDYDDYLILYLNYFTAGDAP